MVNESSQPRHVVITGASSGIGRAAALRLDGQGVNVHAGVRRQEDAAALKAEASDRLNPVLLDVTDQDSISAAKAEVAAEAGDRGLHGLVNNAGISVPGPLEFLPLEDLRTQLEVNVIGQIAVTQAFLPQLRRARGRIVNVGSIGGRTATPFLGAYNASKFALEALTDALRMELRPWNLSVSIIEPGAVATPMWEKGFAKADEIEAKISDEGKRLYADALDALRDAARGMESQAVSPDRVIDAISHALFADRPKTRYLVGSEARIRAALAKLAPDRLQDALISWQLGLPKKG